MSRQVSIIAHSPGETEQATSSATEASLPDSVLYRDGDPTNKESDNKANAVFITCETNPVRFAFNVAPTQDGGTGLGHVLAAGESIRLTGWGQIKNFQYITKAATDHGTLQMTPEY